MIKFKCFRSYNINQRNNIIHTVNKQHSLAFHSQSLTQIQMSQQLQLLAIARHLSSLIDKQINSSPGEPQLIISALKLLIPEAEPFFVKIQELPDEEDQWNHVINFIETQVFDEGMEFGFQKLDTEEIIEVYKVVVEMVQEAVGGQEQEQNQDNQEESHQANEDLQNGDQNQPEAQQHSNESNQTASGQESSSNQHLKHVEIQSKPVPNSKNQESLNYIQNVRKEQQEKKKQLQTQHKTADNKPQNKKKEQSKQNSALKQKNKNQPLKQQKKLPQKQKANPAQKQKQLKSSSVLSKPENQASKIQEPHTKSLIKQNTSSKNPLNESNQKHNKSHNESNKQKSKKQRPKTAANKPANQKPSQGNKNNMKSKKSSINLNQRQRVKNEQTRPKSCQRNQREANIMKQRLDELVIQTINEAMKKKDKRTTKKQLKSNPLMRDNYVTEVMQKAARTYKYEAKNHTNEQRKRQHEQKMARSTPFQHLKKDNYMKLIKHKQQAMQQQVLTSQLKYYYQLRDKKLAYIKHMHKLMQKLQKERKIDLHKKQTELTKQQKQKIIKKIEQADNLFQDNMKGIKENYVKERQKNRIKAGEEVKVLAEMQKNLVKNKENQLNVMKCLWEQERMKLDLIAKDEEKIKSKLEDMYRKNKVS